MATRHGGSVGGGPAWDHSTAPDFLAYCSQKSLSAATLERFDVVKGKILGLLAGHGRVAPSLDVLDIGCGAGTQCALWARDGHRVTGLDISADLVALGQERAAAAGLRMRLDVGSATELPYPDESFDVCLMPELLEHVPDWEACVTEAVRVLRPGGILYLSTTNFLCPVQEEFNLPLYSWYPAFLKHHFERLAVTTHPEIANHARYPAVHWFSYFGLAKFLRARGMHCRDRFDLLAMEAAPGSAKQKLLALVCHVPPLRLIGHVLTDYAVVYATKMGA